MFTSDFACALTVLGTVFSTPSRDRVIIDAGSISVAKENVPSVMIRPEDWKLAWLQEAHGCPERIDGPPPSIGDKIEITPYQICTATSLYDHFVVLRNEVVEAVWDISLRGKSQ